MGKELNPSYVYDQEITSNVIYMGLTERYGTDAVDAVLKNLEIDKTDLPLGDNTKIILRILNGEL